jgi:uncharacterized membrane protein YcaP (DUF421 family)
MISAIVRTVVIYFLVLLALRIMGKRELAQLSPFDFVVAIIIAELAALPMEEKNIPLWEVLIPIGVLVVLEIGLSYIALKSERARSWIYGSPTVVIACGKILDRNMRKLRYNTNDLLAQLRDRGAFDVADVEFAIVEVSGSLSIILKAERRPLNPQDMNLFPPKEEIPIPIIMDGKVIHQNLEFLGYPMEWLTDSLGERGLQINSIFLATYTRHYGLRINGIKGEPTPKELFHIQN